MSTEDVDAYIAALPRSDQRAALQDLRMTLRALLPDHLETISYAMPGFRQPGPKGKMVAGYAAFARNCGYYPHSGSILPQFKDDLAGWKFTPGALQFTPVHPLPPDLIARLVAARLAEIAA
ncbi:MAG: DUF1801 domain-containing protein [Candidatus Saccharibacteria bacterium]|nr:DUF1801 domain-containing protein [Pseudorhodobacter sp.]